MQRSASICLSGSKAGKAIHATVPRNMNRSEAGAFFPALQKFVVKATGHTGCYSGLPIFIFEEAVENAIRVDLGKAAARGAAGQ